MRGDRNTQTPASSPSPTPYPQPLQKLVHPGVEELALDLGVTGTMESKCEFDSFALWLCNYSRLVSLNLSAEVQLIVPSCLLFSPQMSHRKLKPLYAKPDSLLLL